MPFLFFSSSKYMFRSLNYSQKSTKHSGISSFQKCGKADKVVMICLYCWILQQNIMSVLIWLTICHESKYQLLKSRVRSTSDFSNQYFDKWHIVSQYQHTNCVLHLYHAFTLILIKLIIFVSTILNYMEFSFVHLTFTHPYDITQLACE